MALQYGKKELFVPVPSDSTIGVISEDFGGYARVSFSGRLELTYPACCIVYQWTILPSETRAKSAEVIAGPTSTNGRQTAVAVGSPHGPPSRAKLLPAIGLLSSEEALSTVGDIKGVRSEPSRAYKRPFPEDDFKEQKVIDRKKQRTTRSRGQRAKVQRGKSRQSE